MYVYIRTIPNMKKLQTKKQNRNEHTKTAAFSQVNKKT